jgi:phosphinothricin acetyltransferase
MFELREATPADVAAINAIYNHYVRVSTCTYDLEPRSEDDAVRWLEAHQDPRYPATVATQASGDGREVIGWASLSPFRPRPAYRFTVEDTVYVRHGHHARGVGRALLADLIARARTLGHHSIVAAISADQDRSVRLHEAAGFTRVALIPEVGYKFDRWLDLAMLQLHL